MTSHPINGTTEDELRASIAAHPTLAIDDPLKDGAFAAQHPWPELQSADPMEDLRRMIANLEAEAGRPFPTGCITEAQVAELQKLEAQLKASRNPVRDWTRFIFGGPIARAGGIVRIPEEKTAPTFNGPHRPGRDSVPSPSVAHAGWRDGTWRSRSTTNRKARRAAARRAK